MGGGGGWLPWRLGNSLGSDYFRSGMAPKTRTTSTPPFIEQVALQVLPLGKELAMQI